MTAEYIYLGTNQQLQNLLLVAMQHWRLKFLVTDLFFYLNSFLVAFALDIVCVKSFRLIEHGKQIIGKPVCIERDERHGT